MDGQEFDKLAKKLTSFASRRQALGGLLGAAAAVAGLGTVAEAKKGKNKLAKRIPKGRGIGKSACANNGCLLCNFGGTPINGQCPPGDIGVCVSGTSNGFCGSGGNACSACTNPERCIPNANGDGGACAEPSAQCSPGQCNVLVNGTVTCRSEEGPNACGSFGVGGGRRVCAPPCPSGSTCIRDAGFNLVCTTATCQATCPDGCCIGPDDPLSRPLGSCQSGGDILACGEGGSTCVSCLAVCGLEGSCVNGECSCLTTTTTTTTTTTDAPPQCNGCTKANGACAPGTRRGACGVGGAACRRCSGKRKKCRNGRCVK